MSDTFDSLFETKRAPVLTVTVQPDEITEELSRAFDYEFDGVTSFEVPDVTFPTDYGIGLIVGPSGSGKSTLLKNFEITPEPEWDPGKAICSHFDTATEASERLSAVGLNSLPVWVKPYHVLSTGEKFRATMARQLSDGATIDEFTSVVDRTVAKSCAYAIRRYVDRHNIRNVTFATCHYDVTEWLQPDWVYDTANRRLVVGRGSLRRPTIQLEILPATHRMWSYFSDHHYLSNDLNISARCWVATWEGVLVGFVGSIFFPSGTIRNAFREHRTVILPEYQGLGIGVRISDAVAEIITREGYRYFSKTAHPRMGEYRERSPLWKATSSNKTKSKPSTKGLDEGFYWLRQQQYAMSHRVCYSHEYIGGMSDTNSNSSEG